MTTDREEMFKLAQKYGCTMEQVESLIKAQYKFVGDIMAKESDRDRIHFPSIRVVGLGIFYCSDKVKFTLNKIKNTKLNK
jgi:hypothetical protein